MFLFFLFPLVRSQYYYTDSEISTICTNGNADSNPPSLSPGNSTISKISVIKSKNYLEQYYNSKDFEFGYQDKLDYAKDIMPFAFFFYMSGISVLIWFMFISCILCKCCYCLSGPATKVQTRGRLMCPPIFMAVFLVGILIFSPFSIYYVNNLQVTIGYMVCVTARWSGGYYYGYSDWKGIDIISNSTSELLDYLNTTVTAIDTLLSPYNDSGISEVSSEIQVLLSNFIGTWSGTADSPNPNYPSYSSSLPESYSCQLCKDILP